MAGVQATESGAPSAASVTDFILLIAPVRATSSERGDELPSAGAFPSLSASAWLVKLVDAAVLVRVVAADMDFPHAFAMARAHVRSKAREGMRGSGR